MKRLIVVALLTCTAAWGQAKTPPPKKLTTKHQVSPLISRLTYLWAQEIRDAADKAMNYDQAMAADDQIKVISKQIDQSIQFDYKTVGDLVVLHMIDNSADRMSGLLYHKFTKCDGCLYDANVNPYICLDRVQDAARNHSVSMVDSTACQSVK